MKYKFDNGGFSDDFYNAFSELLNNNENNNLNDDINHELDDDNLDDILSLDDGSTIQQSSDFLQNILNNEEINNDSMGAISIVENHTYNNYDLSWLKTKNDNVNIKNTSLKISQYLNSLPPQLKAQALATSGSDGVGVHSKNSKHFSGNALDLRYNKNLYNYIINDPIFKRAGLKILNSNHGTAPHIHIEE